MVYQNYPTYKEGLDENLSVVWNRLIARSEAEYICLLNTDVLCEEGWLKKLIEVFKKEKNVGCVGPITNACGVDEQKTAKTDHYFVVDTRMLSGFCMVFPKRIWEEVGGFDEEYKIYGEDSDFFYRVKKAGYRLLIRKDVFIHHFKGQSAIKARREGKDVFKLAAESARRFKNKCLRN